MIVFQPRRGGVLKGCFWIDRAKPINPAGRVGIHDPTGCVRGNRGRVTCPHVTGRESDVSRGEEETTRDGISTSAWWDVERLFPFMGPDLF